MRGLLLFLLGFGFADGLVRAAEPTVFVTDADPGRAERYGLARLAGVLAERGIRVQTVTALPAGAPAAILTGAAARLRLAAEKNRLPDAPESVVIRRLEAGARSTLAAWGADDRGAMYALLEVAEAVRHAPAGDPEPWLRVAPVAESPAVRDRSLSVYTMNRAQWESRFYDERYWVRYFDLLATSRFNRFLIVFGYENGGFLAPPYPYFFDTPGFPGVAMEGLGGDLQARNLAALNRLIELAHDRGIAVSLGIWDHIYRGAVQAGGAEWVADYRGRTVPNSVTGVTTANLNAYTLASLKTLLERVPALDALQFRVHEESGLKREEMAGFWREVFAHVQKVKPGMLIEARAKGTPDAIIDTALAQGVNLRIETKYWMEQMGLPYHPTHVNPPNQRDRRHGYADLLRYPQRYQIAWRLWNGGTTRVLLWGDPDYVRRYAASTQLYASPNFDVQEPLATKMEAQRPDMPVFDLMPARYRHYDYEFERYWHFFQVWGRVGYNPQVSPEIWRREFAQRFGATAGAHLEAGLHRASGVLPMIVAAVYPYKQFPTTRGWAERQSLGKNLADYANNEGTDTEQFESFTEAAKRILASGTGSKRAPDETSRWLDATAAAILAEVGAAERAADAKRGNEFDATVTDLRILAQLARFHARRALAAVHYNLFLRSQKLAELVAATYAEKDAVGAWRDLVAAAGDRYAFDLAMGARDFSLCGHWRDELRRLEAGLKELEDMCCPPDEAVLKEKVWTPAREGDRTPPQVEHARLQGARAGQSLRIAARVTDESGVQSVRLRYRRVNQFDDYATRPMTPGVDGLYAATVPGDAVVAGWDFMYFIEVIDARGNGRNWPDLAAEMPYVIVPVAP
jgi:hypothetical protein